MSTTKVPVQDQQTGHEDHIKPGELSAEFNTKAIIKQGLWSPVLLPSLKGGSTPKVWDHGNRKGHFSFVTKAVIMELIPLDLVGRSLSFSTQKAFYFFYLRLI